MSTPISRPVIKRRGHPQTNPNSLKNLIPYKPGQNGHQGGYPMKERLLHALDKPLKAPNEQSPVGDRIVFSTIEGAILREPTPFKEVWDRVAGKLTDTHALLGDIVIEVVYVDRRSGKDNNPS